MIFKRFEPLTKEEKAFFMGEIPPRLALTIFFLSIYVWLNLEVLSTNDVLYKKIVFLMFLSCFLSLGLHILISFLIDIRNNQKKIFVFELTKKQVEEYSDTNDYLLFHHEKQFKIDRDTRNIEKFYAEIAIGDIIELHQLPKSEEFIRIQKIENITKIL